MFSDVRHDGDAQAWQVLRVDWRTLRYFGLRIEDGVPGTFLKEREAGRVFNNPAAIVAELRAWLAEKREKGEVPLLSAKAQISRSRPERHAKLVRFLQTVIR